MSCYITTLPYLTGTVTDQDGNFSISTDMSGNLTAKCSFAGYETSEMTVPSSGKAGIIKLAPSTADLGEVVVRAARPYTSMKGNALVTNVEGSSLAIAGTANDEVTRVPIPGFHVSVAERYSSSV